MQLSHENYRARWFILVAVWAVVAADLWLQADLIEKYLGTAGQLGLRGVPANTPLKQIYPAFAADAHMWIRHALSLIEDGGMQLRFTMIDNAPHGREVHWNSAWAWGIAGAGWIHHLFTGLPIAAAVERATLWFNPLVMFGFVVLFSSWATRYAGAIVGAVVAIAMGSHDRIYEGFFPGYVDHHGLLTLAVFGLVLGAAFMGGGWWQEASPDQTRVLPGSSAAARNGAVFSALSGAFGLWVSAASTIPPIALVGFAGALTILTQGRSAQQNGSVFDPQAWRLWGRVGATASMVLYLFEYFPRHLSFRLDPNHPLHALAWLGGAELIAQLGERWLGPRESRLASLGKLVWPIVAVCAAPAVIIIGGTKVFSVFDQFMWRLHNDYIQEFLPMWRTLRMFDNTGRFQVLVYANLPLFAAIATLSYRRRENPIVLWFATYVAALLTIMAWSQSRWLLNVTGPMITLVVVLLACWTARLRPLLRWVIAIAMVGALFVPSAVWRYLGSRSDLAARRVSPKDAIGALNRDIAAALRDTQKQGEIVVLTSPNSSVGIGYYGRFKTLGTLYWENSDGLKSAAAIYSARSEQEAATLIRAHGVTHIAIITEENFIEQYHRLLYPNASAEERRRCFGNRLLLDKTVPQWLQMIPYKVPDDLASLNVGVMLFKVNFKQTLAEAIYNVALTQISQGAVEEADRTLDILIQQAPHVYQPWLRRGEIHLARLNWDLALENTLKGISLAPPAERPALYASAGGAFYDRKQHALAVRIYRTALREQFMPSIAAYLAWVFATSVDDSLRNGSEALALAQQALSTDPNSPSYLSAQAAALAELGRMQEAAVACERALVNAKLRGELTAVPVFEQRLAILKSGKPLRN